MSKKNDLEKMLEDKHIHESKLVLQVKDDKVKYVASIVLGLVDALIELTVVLAGLSSSIANTLFIVYSGVVVGATASLSMAASNYLAIESEKKTDHELNSKKAAAYTGIAYMITVLLLVLPSFLLQERFLSLALALATSIVIVVAFSFYNSVLLSDSFQGRIKKMLLLALELQALLMSSEEYSVYHLVLVKRHDLL